MIQKRGTRWRVVVQARRDELTGKRRQLSGSAATERDAVELQRSFRLRVERAGGARVRLHDLVDEWWASGPRLAPTSLASYRSNLDRHVLPLLGDRYVDEIRPRLVASFMRHLGDNGLSPGTVRRVRTVLSSVISFGVAMEYLESNPVMKVPPPELDAPDRVAPTIEETARILLAAEAPEQRLFRTGAPAMEATSRRRLARGAGAFCEASSTCPGRGADRGFGAGRPQDSKAGRRSTTSSGTSSGTD
jgi:hypothetical protein